LAGYNDILGITQKWINCADVKIIADPDRPKQIYKPDPVRTLPEMPPVYVFGEWAGFLPNITQSKWTNLTPDPYKYTGAGVQCLWIAKIQIILFSVKDVKYAWILKKIAQKIVSVDGN